MVCCPKQVHLYSITETGWLTVIAIDKLFIFLLQALNRSDNASEQHFNLKLLPGEIEVARARRVNLYVEELKEAKKSVAAADEKLGTLIITNFRVSFTLFDNALTTEVSYQENNFLGKYDVALSNVDKIYQITDKKRTAITPNCRSNTRVDAVRIICKTFRHMTYDFSASLKGEGKHIADALARLAFPTQHNLLFLYNYR